MKSSKRLDVRGRRRRTPRRRASPPSAWSRPCSLVLKSAGMPPLHLAVLLDAAPERHALQVALAACSSTGGRGRRRPPCGCRGARGRSACRGARRRSRRTLMPPSRSRTMMHRALADPGEPEVARIRDLGLQAHVAPVRPVEDLFQLRAVELRVGVGRGTRRAGAAPAGRGFRGRSSGVSCPDDMQRTNRGKCRAQPLAPAFALRQAFRAPAISSTPGNRICPR